jgi:tetratricopeptide (TPR) repeat protein
MDAKENYLDLLQPATADPDEAVLQQYLDGHLTREAAFELEQKINASPNLAAMLEGLAWQKEHPTDLENAAKRLEAKIIQLTLPPQEKDKRKFFFPTLSILGAAAATISLLLVSFLGFHIIRADRQTIVEKTYEANAFAYTRAKSATPEEISSAIEMAFQEGNHQQVILLYQKNLLAVRLNPADLFYAGNSFLATRQYQEAVDCFAEVMALNEFTDNLFFRDEAQYYLALSYLALGNTDKAWQLAGTMQEDPLHKKNQEAKDLYRALRYLRIRQAIGLGS